MWLVEMSEVGRNKASATAVMDSVNFENLLKMARPHLVSSNISFVLDGGEGLVYAGFRSVGKIKVSEMPVAKKN